MVGSVGSRSGHEIEWPRAFRIPMTTVKPVVYVTLPRERLGRDRNMAYSCSQEGRRIPKAHMRQCASDHGSCRVIEIYRQHFLSTPEDGPWQCMVAGRAGLGSSGTKIQIRPYFTHTPSHHSSHHITHNMLHNRWLYRGSRGNSSAKVCDLA